MLPNKISKQVLTIGCEYHHPKGGVAQMMYNYERYVFPLFKCIINSGSGNKLTKLLKAIEAWLQMGVRLLVDRDIRIVHIHTASYNSFKRSAWYVKMGKLMGRKVILHIHGGGFKEYYATNPEWISSILNRCDALITLSESWKGFFQEVTTCANISVLENVVPFPVEKQCNKASAQLHFLFLGLIDEAKGIFDLISVLNGNKQVVRGKMVLHIGGNGKVSELKKIIQNCGLEEVVKYEGWVAGNKKIELLQDSDIFILPSYVEGLPVSILEAMSYRMPILSTPVGGIPEVVENGVNGILFTPGDNDRMMTAIMRLLENDDEREKMGEESFNRVKPHFPDCVARKLETIYCSVW